MNSELFQVEPVDPPSGKAEPAADVSQYFILRCSCGETGGVHLRHWERVRCSDCGLTYWALKPKANGPMKLYPWPGDPNTLEPAATNHRQPLCT